jgi:hypothetical protein
MRLSSDGITEIFYVIDEFCIQFEASTSPNLIGNIPKRKPGMSKSEVITLMTLFHTGSFSQYEALLFAQGKELRYKTQPNSQPRIYSVPHLLLVQACTCWA